MARELRPFFGQRGELHPAQESESAVDGSAGAFVGSVDEPSEDAFDVVRTIIIGPAVPAEVAQQRAASLHPRGLSS